MLLSRCEVCGCKKSEFIKKQEAGVFLSSLGIKTPLSKVLLLGFFCFRVNNSTIQDIKWLK